MNRVYIRPYHPASKACKSIKEALGAVQHKIDGTSRYASKKGDVVINYGNTEPLGPQYDNAVVLNYPDAVAKAVDKAKYHSELGYIDQYMVPTLLVQEWGLEDLDSVIRTVGMDYGWKLDDCPVIARTLTKASQGRGTYYFDSIHDIPEDLMIEGRKVKLVSKYIKKSREFRVHVMGNRIIDAVEKRRNLDIPKEEVNWKIRNHQNGWVFCRDGLEVPEIVQDAARTIVQHLGLFFGAADVIYNEHHDRAYVVEVNTAPGVEGSTVDRYSDAFAAYIQEKRGQAPEPKAKKKPNPAGDILKAWANANDVRPHEPNIVFANEDVEVPVEVWEEFGPMDEDDEDGEIF